MGNRAFSPMPPLPAGYEKIEPIGKGGMGEVFRAFDPRLKRWVALKQVRLDRAGPNRLARFRNEAEALAKLLHSHVVNVHGFTDTAGQAVLEMEYIAGGTFDDRLREWDHEPDARARDAFTPTDATRLIAIPAWYRAVGKRGDRTRNGVRTERH
jgi:serine/threonine protein kinase